MPDSTTLLLLTAVAVTAGGIYMLRSQNVATTAVRSLTRTCRIWRSDASAEASGR